MRFAITGIDRCFSVFEGLLAEGWQAVKLFTVMPNAAPSTNRATIEKAMSLNIPIQASRMDDGDLRDLADRGCEVLVCAGYDWRIGDWRREHTRHAVNFHPSPLPQARGPYPAFRALLEGWPAWGVTCHKLEHAFDTGDILDAEIFGVADSDCHESLSLKTQMAFGRLSRRVACNFPELWAKALPQGAGSYWKRSTEADRTIDFATPVESIMRKVRAFGLIETVAAINGQPAHVRRAVGWTEGHSHAPGTVVHVDGRRTVVAALDGYIGLIEWSPLPEAAMSAVGRTGPATRD